MEKLNGNVKRSAASTNYATTGVKITINLTSGSIYTIRSAAVMPSTTAALNGGWEWRDSGTNTKLLLHALTVDGTSSNLASNPAPLPATFAAANGDTMVMVLRACAGAGVDVTSSLAYEERVP